MTFHRANSIVLLHELIVECINTPLMPHIHQILFPCRPYLGNFDASEVDFPLEGYE